MKNQTIAAIATAPGEGGIGVIRISGKDALNIAQKVFSRDILTMQPNTVRFGKIIDQKKIIDDAICLFMKAPKSYTGEDVIELQCHGSVIGLKRILQIILNQGATLAKPGEFTYRAFINGKIDLSQAESIQKLISAKSSIAYEHAQNQLQGRLSSKIEIFQKKIISLLATVEALNDFPDEDIEEKTHKELLNQCTSLKQEIQKLLSTFEEGRKIHLEPQIVLAGAPNTGKSSLLNALLEVDRALVSNIPGTTRDLVKEEFCFNGRLFQFVDTAGIRATNCAIETQGIALSHAMMQKADLILWVMDANNPSKEGFEPGFQNKTLFILNKIDLAQPNYPADCKVSSKTTIGILELKDLISKKITSTSFSKEEVLLSENHHKNALEKTLNSLQSAQSGLQQLKYLECIASDLKEALLSLGIITGIDANEALLDAIFSQFCIGK